MFWHGFEFQRMKTQAEKFILPGAPLKNCPISKLLTSFELSVLPFCTDKSEMVHLWDLEVSSNDLSFGMIKSKNKSLSLSDLTCYMLKNWTFSHYPISRNLKKLDEITILACRLGLVLHHTIIQYVVQSWVYEEC